MKFLGVVWICQSGPTLVNLGYTGYYWLEGKLQTASRIFFSFLNYCLFYSYCETGKQPLIPKIVSVTGKMTNEWSKVLLVLQINLLGFPQSIYHENFGVENICFAKIYFTFEIGSKYEFHMLNANKKLLSFVASLLRSNFNQENLGT